MPHRLCSFTILIGFVLSGSLFGQTAGAIFRKASPEVDSALRERVKQFIELQQQKKFRQAESLVCEESKEEYYGSEKKPLDKWELSEIAYEDGHQKATVVIVMDSVMTTMAGVLPMKRPWATRWKVEGGAWCIYFPDPLKEGYKTPFGFIQADERKDVTDPTSVLSNRPRIAGLKEPVTLSKTVINLMSSAQSSDEIVIANQLPGPISVEVAGTEIPGLKWQITPQEVQTSSKGAIKFKYEPPNAYPKSDTQLTLIIRPLGLKVPLTVVFQTPGGVPAIVRKQ